jgi:DNA-binding transcriptional LysR family regulator
MRGSEFAELRAFAAVAERRSFAKASAYLGLVPSTVSETVRGLEARLGVRLLNRTTRKVSLTDAGERLYARIRPAMLELTSAVSDLDDFRDTPAGTLRLTVSSIAAQIILAPALSAFLAAYPAIVLDVSVDDEQSDIIDKRFDAGIRVGWRVARDMHTVRVSEASRLVAVASPGYLANHPAPSAPQDLHQHDCIRFRNDNHVFAWEFERGKNKIEVAVTGPLIVDSMDLMVGAALAGVGIGFTIESYVAAHIASGALVPLLLEWSPARHIYYLYYSGRGQIPAPLKALIDFFRNEPSNTP